MTTLAARDLVARSTAAQGLPERVTDPGALARVAAILAGARRDSAPVLAGAPVNNTITTFVATSPKGGRRGPI